MSTLENEQVLRHVSFVKLASAAVLGCVFGAAGLVGVLVIGYFLLLSNAASFYYVSKVFFFFFFSFCGVIRFVTEVAVSENCSD
jgi:hypothetical protein